MSNFKKRLRLTKRSAEPVFLLLRTRKCGFWFIFVTFHLFSACFGKEQKFAMEPQDQTAIIGTRVTLPCRVENKSGRLQWTKDGFGLGFHRDLNGFETYMMIGSDEEGDFSLDIRNVSLEDDANYQCQVSTGSKGEPEIRSRYARLTVLVPPEAPKILQGDFISTTEDSRIKLECISVGGKPPAEITWVDSNVGVITQGVTYSMELLPDGQRSTARSVLKMTAKKEHHNQTFTCQAQNTADRAYRSASIMIEVKFAPKIKLIVKNKNSKGKIPEGENITIVCQADANPSNMSYRWYLNEDVVIGNTSSMLVIYNATRSYNGAIVKCEVNNAVGKSEESETLEVTYPPSFKTDPKDVEGEIGSLVTLSCDVDSYPPPEIEWVHHEEDQNIRVGTTANLSLHVDSHTSGRYVCKAKIDGYPEIQGEASVFIKGPPRIFSNGTQYGSQGDTIKVECAAVAVPKIDSIVWTFNNREIDTIHDQDYAFQEDLHPGGVINSTLIIRESQSKHFGTYKCNVSNEYGSDSIEIILRPSKSFPLLLILFGVTSGMIAVATIIMLVILCQRKQRKNKMTNVKKPDVTVTNEDLFKENDRNSNISDLKLELRQVNGNCEVDYSNAGSNSTLCSNAKLGSGIPLAGSVPLTAINQKHQPYRYSNDYSDPAFSNYKTNGYTNGYQTYVHYGQDYTPGSLRIQSPTLTHGGDKLTPNRSINGSLPRSVDSTSTVQYNPGNGSQSNSLQRPFVNRLDSSHDINTVALSSPEVSRIPNGGLISGVDVRYAATYGNPHLRTGPSLGYTVNTAKPASTPAPPPYSAIRSSVLMPSGTSSHSITSPTSVVSPQCATSPITTSTISTDSNVLQVGVPTSSTTPQSPGAHYIVAPSNRNINNTIVTKKGSILQSPLATHV